jgi:excisionase family DNA binding protein
MTDEPLFLSTDEAARSAGMSVDWVRKQIQAGRLPARAWRVGRRRIYRIATDDWERFVADFSGDALDERFDGDSPGS